MTEAETAHFFDQVSGHLSKIYPDQSGAYARMASALVRELKLAKAPRVLDLGCGTGTWLRALARARPAGRFLGTDISTVAIHLAKRAPVPDNCRFEVRSWGTRDCFTAAPFDLVTCLGNTLSHSAPAEYRRLFLRIRQSLSTGGTFLCDTYPDWAAGFTDDGFRVTFRGGSRGSTGVDVAVFADQLRRDRIIRQVQVVRYALSEGSSAAPRSLYSGRCIQYRATTEMLTSKLREVGFARVRLVRLDRSGLTVALAAEAL